MENERHLAFGPDLVNGLEPAGDQGRHALVVGDVGLVDDHVAHLVGVEIVDEAAQGLAKRILSGAEKDDEGRLKLVYRICLAREPSAKEREILQKLLTDFQRYYLAHQDEAKALAGEGLPDGLDPVDAAPWVATVRVVTNLDEFVTCP